MSKTPDFKVFKDGELVFFCEAKSIEQDQWLQKQFEKTQPGEIAGGLRDDPIPNRLSNKIHEAAKQFKSVNPLNEHPNVLFFVNHDRDCGVEDLRDIFTGYFHAEGGTRHPVYQKFSEGRMKEDKQRIHLFVWLDGTDEYRLFNAQGKHLLKLYGCLGVDPKSVKPVQQFVQ